MPEVETVHLQSGADYVFRLSYSGKEAHGIIVLIVISLLSMIAVVALLSGIAVSAYNTRNSANQHLFVRTHVAAYFVCFLLSDLLQAIGTLINISWIHSMAVTVGVTCTAQGVIKEMADVSSAFWTVVMAIHTFFLLVIEMRLRPFVLWATLVGGWSAIFAIVISGPAVKEDGRGPFYGISEYWCWISPTYKAEIITLDYMLMFLAAFFAGLLYLLIYLKLRGNLVIEGHRPRFVRVSAEELSSWRERKLENESLQIAMRMWIYPMAYIVLIMPIAITRFVSFAGHSVSVEATIFSNAVFLLIGIANVTLFLTTKSVLPPKAMQIFKISHPTVLQASSPTSEHSDTYYEEKDPYYAAYYREENQKRAIERGAYDDLTESLYSTESADYMPSLGRNDIPRTPPQAHLSRYIPGLEDGRVKPRYHGYHGYA